MGTGQAASWEEVDVEPDFHQEGFSDPWGPPRLSFTKPFIDRATPKTLDRFSRKFNSVVRFFPEVRGELTIGLTTSYKGLATMWTDDGSTREKISFPPLGRKGVPTCYVIGHELMHIVQAKGDSLPATERSCDLFTLARLPPCLIDHPPIYLRLPYDARRCWPGSSSVSSLANLAHELAIEAVIIREENPRYIRWWEKEFAVRMKESTTGPSMTA